MLWLTPDPVEGSRPAAVEAYRVRAKLITAEKDRVEDDLKASAQECGAEGFKEDGYTVKMVSRVDQLPPKPATERIVSTLIVTKDDALAVPKAKKARKS